jgi:hypothetical protein
VSQQTITPVVLFGAQPWPGNLEELVVTWITSGVNPKKISARLLEMGYVVNQAALFKKRKTLGLPIAHYGFRWEKNPEAAAFLEEKRGFYSAAWIASQLKEKGYQVSIKAVELRAHREGLLGKDNSDEMTQTAATKHLLISNHGLRAAIKRLGLRCRGQGRFRFIPIPVMVTLCAHYQVEPPYLNLESYNVGQEVYACQSLRMNHSRARGALLVPRSWSSEARKDKGDRWDKDDRLGVVVAVHRGALEVELRYGRAMVAPALVRPAKKEDREK